MGAAASAGPHASLLSAPPCLVPEVTLGVTGKRTVVGERVQMSASDRQERDDGSPAGSLHLRFKYDFFFFWSLLL